MYIKDSTFKKIIGTYIIFTSLLWIYVCYSIIDSMVSYKYEHEKEMINLHSNLATEYIKQDLFDLHAFMIYITINLLFLAFVLCRKQT
jgi:hypothetical protein